MDLLLRIITFLYAGTGVVTVLGYLPTIKDLYHRKRPSANINSYIIWTLCSGIVLLYMMMATSDLLLQTVTGLNFLFCFIILILAIRLKYF